ncbi:hypothetical protein GYMLUDRAFT_810510 [Collybiopsis luxurians FD-317 M1]|nr:hypothetical protein GYMLUDRAFT_810510 [Collybiopsis luxurians FD-317 M1]
MPSHNRHHRRHKGNKSQEEDRYSREDDSFSHSRQSDTGYARYSSGSGRNSYDVNVREVPSSSSRVAESWQQQQSDYAYQGRYHGTGKSRREEFEQVETRERDSGWSTRRSTSDVDLYSHPQREEWPPPPRYDENHTSTSSYSNQYSTSYSQQSWPDEHDNHNRHVSRNDRDSRWHREERPAYAQESDNGWESRRSDQNRRQSWDESSGSRFRSPSPLNRQWEPAPGWNSSSYRGYESQPRRSNEHDQQNGHRNHTAYKKSSKNSKKSYSNGKSNGSNKRDWKEVEVEDFNNWSRRQRDIYGDGYEGSSSRRKHSQSKSRSRSPAESHYSYRSRRRTPSPPPRASPLNYSYPDSPPPSKRRKRNSSPRSARSRSPDYVDRGRSGWPSPSAEKRSSLSPRRRDFNGSTRMSISPASVRSYRDRTSSPTPVDYAHTASPQRLLDTSIPPPVTPSVDYATQDPLPPAELRETIQETPQPQQKSGKSKKKNKRKNASQTAQNPNAAPQLPSPLMPPPSQLPQFHDPSQQIHNSYMMTYQYAAQYFPYQLSPGVNMNVVGGGIPIPIISASALSSPTLPSLPHRSAQQPLQPPHHPSLPANPYLNPPTNFSQTPDSPDPNHRLTPGSFIPIRNARLKTSKSSLRQFFPGFNEDDDSASSTPQPQREIQPPTSAESSKQENTLPANSSTISLGLNAPHFVPSSSNQLPPPSPGPSSSSDPGAPKQSSEEPTQALQVEEACAPAQPSETSLTHTPSSVSGTAAPAAPASRPDLYSIVGQVGEGTFGKVYKARNTISNIHVALKRIRMESERDGFPVTAMREIKLLQSLRHDNVVRLYEMMVSSGSVYMVFEYMDHDLTGVLSQTQFQFSVAHLKSLCHQMFRGLAYLHHKGVIHRDIKGSNILVNNQGELKLADFGLARFYQKRRRADYTNRVITLWYRPPELLLGATVYGPEVDIWSAGCIMLELFTKKPVFQGNDEISQLDVIYKIFGTPTLQRWSGFANLPWYEMVKPKDPIPNRFKELFRKWMSPAALDLAERLLDFDPTQRVTAVQALETPYFLTEEPKAEKPTRYARNLSVSQFLT